MPYYKAGWSVFNFKVLLLMETIEDSVDKIYRKVNNNGHKYIGLPTLLGNPSILLLDPELIERILIKDFQYFHDRIDFEINTEVNPLDANLFNLQGQMWRKLRAKLSPIFTSGKLKWMFKQVSFCTDLLLDKLQEKANGEDFLIRDLVSCYGLDVIASCAFGIDTQSQNNPNNEFREKATKIFRPSTWTFLKGMMRFIWPKLAKTFRLSSVDEEVTKFFCDLTKDAIKLRKESGFVRNDFVQLMLQLKEKGYVEYEPAETGEVEHLEEAVNEKLEFTDELLAAQAFIFFVAGFEPVSTLIIFALYCLSTDAEAQTKVREEIAMVKKKYGEINYDSLKDMTYLESVMAETLRIHSPARLIIRSCSKNYKLEDGHEIEKKIAVMIPTYSLQFDPKYFPEPEKFKPERFQDGEQLSIRQGHGVYIPFGDGPRVCIARRFALLEAKLALARIVERFKIHKSSKNIEPLKRNPKVLIIDPIGGLWLRMEKISPTE